MLPSAIVALLFSSLIVGPSAILAAPTGYAGSQTRSLVDLDMRDSRVWASRRLTSAGIANREDAAMTTEVEMACRKKGGTPELKNGEATCNMNPTPLRRTPSVTSPESGYNHRSSDESMSPEQEKECRRQGGTPELQNGQASCNMNPTPKRRTPEVVNLRSDGSVHTPVDGHGR